jgi:hypothetical protein
MMPKLEEKGVTKTIFLALFSVPIGDFMFKKMELDLLAESHQLICLDLGPLLDNKMFKKTFLRRKHVSAVKSIDSWTNFLSTLATIRSSHAESSIVVLNHFNPTTLKRIAVLILVRFYLGKLWSHVIGFENGGVPICQKSDHSVGEVSIWWNRLGYLKNPKIFILKVYMFLSAKAGILLADLNTHVLVAGSDWEILAKNKYSRNHPKIIEGHSCDYSSMFFKNSDMNFQVGLGDIAVFLEPPVPLFVGDEPVGWSKLKITPNKWFSSFVTFFEHIEKSMGVRVVIAAHYKTNHPSPCTYYGNRQVVYNKTKELIECCSLVITINSTAISYAISLNKPLIFLITDEWKIDTSRMRETTMLAEASGATIINTNGDSKFWPNEPPRPNCNMYKQYIDQCLSSTEQKKTNMEIIIENVM